jgi:hypothetical protein
MHYHVMSTTLQFSQFAIQAVLAPMLNISFWKAMQLLLSVSFIGGFLILFKPLLTGIARALVLVVKPKMSKAQRLAMRSIPSASLPQA